MPSAIPVPLHGEVSARKPAAFPWTPDNCDGTFTNPIIHADYSDPDVTRHGDDFYLTASSFNCTPGLPILHSRDLVNWTLVGHALRNVPGRRYEQVQPGCGVWAPSIRFHDGKFWIFFPTPDEGIYLTTAQDPRGPWSKPHLVQAGTGLIDPCPLWDDDGQAYLVHAYAGSRAGIKHRLRVCPMAPDGSRLLGDGRIVFHEPERHPTTEGPKFLKKDGWYYLFAPAGGVATGWQLALRSWDVFGPYEERIVLETGSTPVNGPHQGAMIDTPNGDWWFVHFQDADLYGRILHLQPVTWKDGWPQVGTDFDGNGIGEPVPCAKIPNGGKRNPVTVPDSSDEFDEPQLGFQWQWQANHQPEWASLQVRRGWLHLPARHVAEANLQCAANLLLQKFPARAFAVETFLEFSGQHTGDEAGLVIAGKTSAALALRFANGKNQLVFRAAGTDHLLATDAPRRMRLKATVADGGNVTFAFAAADGFSTVPFSFQATPGVWIGAKTGLYCLSRGEAPGGFAEFDYFRIAPAEGLNR